ncbi:hypothetical protein [Cysteiniphilum sp. QT6929]|nr:hypothetical protein [Cysteiniphilum sp. QT6929]WHN66054.1 hypothetical protein NYP54_02165 [Cysteiniphilum sp. QT6929]
MHYYAWSILRSSSDLNQKMTKPEMKVIWTIGGVCAISVIAIAAIAIFLL